MLKINIYFCWSTIFFITSMMSMLMGLKFLMLNNSMFMEWTVYSSNSIEMCFIIYFDWISLMFMFVVLLISSMVILYSSIYMGDYNYSSIRFLYLVLMFVTSMVLMILSPSLISIMLGWDGLGLVSYCLVIYYSSLKSYLAGMITCLTNRLGDIGLLISISWVFSYGSWNFMFYNNLFSEPIYYLIIVSCFTKSAQIPFSSWLPAAMAAPTPVSSLVHSSTLVTAGVYLLIRFYNSLLFVNEFLLFISSMTMIMSSVCANYEFDLKKIIALSTLSQLGLMMSCLFMGLEELSYFHLLSHAMFKALLFLCSGVIIHLMSGNQDIRMMGSICMVMPITSCCFNISNMSLCGFPFMSGFYSKDLIVEISSFYGMNIIVYMLFYLGLGLTASYSIRLLYYSILTNFKYGTYLSMAENISVMKISLLILSSFSLTFGAMFIWLTNMDLTFIILPLNMKLSTMILVSLGIYTGYKLNFMKNLFFKEFYYLNGSMWFMYSYSYSFLLLNFHMSKTHNHMIMWGEYYGGSGVTMYMIKISNYLQLMYLNSLKIFLISITMWMLFMF
uniref:NADH-ubiquinone oxidoreductase chain 5 n=1 Tax=Balclutha sp. EMHAU-2015-Zz052711 TaxID=2036851 RepID=A0A343K1A7_9HEMI|nr:NADH dehydrogenase subunit 5 [Balclutha sp. EMHAU-2015-Zz052711]